MGALINVILPVFLVLGFGYVAVWRKVFSDENIDGLMQFTQNFAIPCLLFSAISTLDLQKNVDVALLGSFYAGAYTCFIVGLLGGRFIFKRDWEDSVAIGFAGLFSNSLMLGLPITERAYGAGALEANYTIIAFHSSSCYLIGITAMEIAKNKGESLASLPVKILKAMFRNALVLGVALGFIVNLSGITLPTALSDALHLIGRTAVPAALFGLGGVLYHYRPEGDLKTIMFVVAISLILHPSIVWMLGKWSDLDTEAFRSAVLTSAVAPGVNAYVFANMYGRAKRVAASAVLFSTVLCIITVWGWLAILP